MGLKRLFNIWIMKSSKTIKTTNVLINKTNIIYSENRNLKFSKNFYPLIIPWNEFHATVFDGIICSRSTWKWHTAVVFNHVCDIVFRRQVFRRRRTLYDRSAWHDDTGQIRISCINLITSPNIALQAGDIYQIQSLVFHEHRATFPTAIWGALYQCSCTCNFMFINIISNTK